MTSAELIKPMNAVGGTSIELSGTGSTESMVLVEAVSSSSDSAFQAAIFLSFAVLQRLNFWAKVSNLDRIGVPSLFPGTVEGTEGVKSRVVRLKFESACCGCEVSLVEIACFGCKAVDGDEDGASPGVALGVSRGCDCKGDSLRVPPSLVQ